MSHTPNYDAKIKTILDNLKPGELVCELTGERWIFDAEHLEWCRRLRVPPSSMSPKTRVKIMLGFATGIAIWKKPSVQTGELILSCIPPDSPYQIMPDKDWHVVDLVNAMDCFMGFGGLDMKNVLYFSVGTGCEDSVDITNNFFLRDSFSVNHCERLFDCQFVFESRDCLSSAFLFDCRNCEYCFGATNKRNKKYLWWNEQLSKEEWEHRRKEVDLRSYKVCQEWIKKFHVLIENEARWPENFNVGSQDSTGDYLSDCVRCHYGFWQRGSRYCFWSPFNEKNEN